MNIFELFDKNKKCLSDKNNIRAIGIDLGTTNSTVAEVCWKKSGIERPAAECIEISQETLEGTYSNILLPSMTAEYQNKIFIGEGVKRLRSLSSEYGLVQNKNLFYECKNEIGTNRTYHLAADGFKSPAEIAGKLLEYMLNETKQNGNEIDNVVITVPASFQLAQRRDTLKAAEIAGINIIGGNLLDEPVAAFLDYIVGFDNNLFSQISGKSNLLVFDFGGGTCDVAIFQMHKKNEDTQIKISPLSVSRYHRLGGGDIDTAVLYDILLPQFLKENNLNVHDLTFNEKKNIIGPAFLNVAEQLKIGICREISRLIGFNKYYEYDKSKIIKVQPGVYTCKLFGELKTLTSPKISAEEFEKVLEQFIDVDCLYVRETEYRMSCSIFAPISDALERCGLTAGKIDYCLLVGGSSLIPQIVDSVKQHFNNSRILTYKNSDDIQTAVARGAAYHSLFLKLFGQSIISPVCFDGISIRTENGLAELIPQNAALPYPQDNSFIKYTNLAMPETNLIDSFELLIEIAATADNRKLISAKWLIDIPAVQGDPIYLEYRYNENQALELNLKLDNGLEQRDFSLAIENPLTNVINPNKKRIRIMELEELLRSNSIEKNKIARTIIQIAELYRDLGQKEKALEYYRQALRRLSSPDAGILNAMGIISGEIGDYRNEEKYYREAAKCSDWMGPLFNLALSKEKQNKIPDAKNIMLEVVDSEPEPAYYTFLALLEAKNADRISDKDRYLQIALKTYPEISMQSKWELGWYKNALSMAGDKSGLHLVQQEILKRNKIDDEDNIDSGRLPAMKDRIK